MPAFTTPKRLDPAAYTLALTPGTYSSLVADHLGTASFDNDAALSQADEAELLLDSMNQTTSAVVDMLGEVSDVQAGIPVNEGNQIAADYAPAHGAVDGAVNDFVTTALPTGTTPPPPPPDPNPTPLPPGGGGGNPSNTPCAAAPASNFDYDLATEFTDPYGNGLVGDFTFNQFGVSLQTAIPSYTIVCGDTGVWTFTPLRGTVSGATQVIGFMLFFDTGATPGNYGIVLSINPGDGTAAKSVRITVSWANFQIAG
jgi:hypothetical protein